MKLRKKGIHISLNTIRNRLREKKHVFSINFEETFIIRKVRGKTSGVDKGKFESRLGQCYLHGRLRFGHVLPYRKYGQQKVIGFFSVQ